MADPVIAPEKEVKKTDTAEAASEAKEDAKAAAPKAKRKSKKAAVSSGKVFIQASYNNTIVTVTDTGGNTIAWASAGGSGFKGARKSTPYAAQVAAEKALEKAEVFGLTEVEVFVKGVGAGRDQAVRGVINRPNVNVLSINDVTPIAHGGCRKKKVRRV